MKSYYLEEIRIKMNAGPFGLVEYRDGQILLSLSDDGSPVELPINIAMALCSAGFEHTREAILRIVKIIDNKVVAPRIKVGEENKEC